MLPTATVKPLIAEFNVNFLLSIFQNLPLYWLFSYNSFTIRRVVDCVLYVWKYKCPELSEYMQITESQYLRSYGCIIHHASPYEYHAAGLDYPVPRQCLVPGSDCCCCCCIWQEIFWGWVVQLTMCVILMLHIHWLICMGHHNF